MVTERIKPFFNPYVAYARSIRYQILPGIALVVFYAGGDLFGIETHILFSQWQRLFPLYAVLLTAFFIGPAYLINMTEKDYRKTFYLISKRRVEATIYRFGRPAGITVEIKGGAIVRITRSPLQRIAGTGDVLVSSGGRSLRLHDIRGFKHVCRVLKGEP